MWPGVRDPPQGTGAPGPQPTTRWNHNVAESAGSEAESGRGCRLAGVMAWMRVAPKFSRRPLLQGVSRRIPRPQSAAQAGDGRESSRDEDPRAFGAPNTRYTDHNDVAIFRQLVQASRQLVQRDHHAPGNMPGAPLLLLAHVQEERTALVLVVGLRCCDLRRPAVGRPEQKECMSSDQMGHWEPFAKTHFSALV